MDFPLPWKKQTNKASCLDVQLQANWPIWVLLGANLRHKSLGPQENYLMSVCVKTAWVGTESGTVLPPAVPRTCEPAETRKLWHPPRESKENRQQSSDNFLTTLVLEGTDLGKGTSWCCCFSVTCLHSFYFQVSAMLGQLPEGWDQKKSPFQQWISPDQLLCLRTGMFTLWESHVHYSQISLLPRGLAPTLFQGPTWL